MMRASGEETKGRQRQRAASSADERIMSKDGKVEMVQRHHTHTHTHAHAHMSPDAVAQTLSCVPAVPPPHPWVAANQQLSGASPLHSAARSKAENPTSASWICILAVIIHQSAFIIILQTDHQSLTCACCPSAEPPQPSVPVPAEQGQGPRKTSHAFSIPFVENACSSS